eukprot:4247146-Prorocentrum_lima.AAC.1
MTSSLVGSEMCIRDRSQTRKDPTAAPWPTAPPPPTPTPRPRSQCRTCAPVSYTHLTLPTICSV